MVQRESKSFHLQQYAVIQGNHSLVLDLQQLVLDVDQGKPAGKAVENVTVIALKGDLEPAGVCAGNQVCETACTGTLASGIFFAPG